MKIKNQVQVDYIRSTRDKPPETNLARAVLSRAFLDSMGYLNPQSSHGRGELSQLKNLCADSLNWDNSPLPQELCGFK